MILVLMKEVAIRGYEVIFNAYTEVIYYDEGHGCLNRVVPVILDIKEDEDNNFRYEAYDIEALIRPVVMLDSTKCKLSDTASGGYYTIVEK